MKALILSDKRKGHENQSIAFCELLGLSYEICEISYANKFLKILSYIFDFFGVFLRVFKAESKNFSEFEIFVGTGSVSYYPLKFLAKKYLKKSVALMWPKGYKKDFSLIIASEHDKPKPLKNVKILPVNLSFLKPGNFYKPRKKAIAFVIGGSNKNFILDAQILWQIKQICEFFKDYEKLITTSPRTPQKIEQEISAMNFDFSAIYSQNQINPLADFLDSCEFVFITQDSVSMISEAVCFGRANIAILPLSRRSEKQNKFDKFIEILKNRGNLQIFSRPQDLAKTAKIEFKELLKGIKL